MLIQPHHNELYAGLAKKRLRLIQTISIVLFAVVLGVAQNAYFHNGIAAIILVFVAILLAYSNWLAWTNRVDIAGKLTMGTLICSFAGLSFWFEGIHDAAISAFPGVMILTAMFCTRRFFYGVFAFGVLAMSFIVMANLQGWHVNKVLPLNLMTLINFVLILSATSFCVWQLASDLRNALSRLEIENGRITDALAEIDELAHHDALTGLPNRLLARFRFEQAVALTERSQQHIALLFLDLDNFKTVNDSLGHIAGDILLKEVATRLKSAVRECDTVSRQGGDEFLMVLAGQAEQESVATVAMKVIDLLSSPMTIEGVELLVTCSIGIALFQQDGTNFDQLLKHADMAMYKAKESGRNAFCFYDAEMNTSVVEQLHLISGIRSALLKDEFKLYYQPQYELKTGRIIGAEALVRWKHPELGFVPPVKFIPVAERSGQIHEIGAWVLEEACRQAKEWQDAGLLDLVVAINLSPIQFRRENIERDVLNALSKSQLAPTSIELELTESLLIVESHKINPLLKRWRSQGIRLSIDDFGTGYSNLGYLSRFEVERLKIDQSFIQRMMENANDANIVRAIIEMAHSLHLEVVAEGVENKAVLDRLTELGCEYGQGYHWSPALPPEQFLEFMRCHQTNQAALMADIV